MNYKFEINHNGETLTFTTRTPGQVGKDILAVKAALGVIKNVGNLEELEVGDNVQPPTSDIPLDKQNWFDCQTGLGIDVTKAATFDKSLQRAVVKYQAEHRLLILCYYFEKYGVLRLLGSGASYEPEEEIVEYSKNFLQVIDSTISFLDSEDGVLGEATLAVLHGWRPQSILSAEGYLHRPEQIPTTPGRILDIVPLNLLSLVVSSDTIQESQELSFLKDSGYLQKIPLESNENNLQDLEEFKETSRNDTDWITESFETEFDFVSLEYEPIFSNSSLLTPSAKAILNSPGPLPDPSLFTNSEKRDRLKSFFYPDPFSSTAPFVIDDKTIGFFLETEYEISSRSNLPTTDDIAINSLMDEALDKVLDFYQKPAIWRFEKTNFGFSTAFFGQSISTQDPERPLLRYPISITEEEVKGSKKYYDTVTSIRLANQEITRLEDLLNPDPNKGFKRGRHVQQNFLEQVAAKLETLRSQKQDLEEDLKEMIETPEFNKLDYWVLSTQKKIDQFDLVGAVQHWSVVEKTLDPIIKFIEFRTPPLRPGVKYRALFEINREKLDLIMFGDSIIAQSQSEEEAPSSTSGQVNSSLAEVCLEQGSEQSARTLEEYKVHARKKRRELVRNLREKIQENSRIEDYKPNLNLGAIGPWDQNRAFSGLMGLSGITDDYQYTKKALNLLIENGDFVLDQLGLTDTDMEDLNDFLEDAEIDYAQDGADELDLTGGFGRVRFTLKEFAERIEVAADDLTEAGKQIESNRIAFIRGSNFRASNEAQKLRSFQTQLLDFLQSENIKGWTSEYDKKKKKDLLSGTERPENVFLEIHYTLSDYSGLGPKDGKRISLIKIEKFNPATNGSETAASIILEEPTGSANLKELKKGESLVRARTVNYVANLRLMTNPYPNSAWDFVKSFWDDKRGACADLGINADKGIAIAIVGNYTSGLKVDLTQDETFSEAFSNWATRNFIDPFDKWIDASSRNLKDSIADTFDEQGALDAFGKLCTVEQIYNEFIDKVDLKSLLCDYLKCIGLPGFDLSLPKFYLPPFPRIPIIGWYGYLWKFLVENIVEILQRILCTFVRTIIDKLAFPFCEEQLEEFIAAGSSATPIMNQALADALTNTGITSGNEAKAKKFFDDVSNIVTAAEICHLLEGKPLDASGMFMLSRLAQNAGLESDLDSDEAIVNYFGVLGTYIPSEICSTLERIAPPDSLRAESSSIDCDDTIAMLRAIRNRLQSGDGSVTEEEINQAMDLAQKNLDDKKKQAEALSGANFDVLLPELYGSDNRGEAAAKSVLSSLPDSLSDLLKSASDGIFMAPKTSYITALSAFVQGLKVPGPDVPLAGSDDYVHDPVLKLEAALQQLEDYAEAVNPPIYQGADDEVEPELNQADMAESTLQINERAFSAGLGDWEIENPTQALGPMYAFLETNEELQSDDEQAVIRRRQSNQYMINKLLSKEFINIAKTKQILSAYKIFEFYGIHGPRGWAHRLFQVRPWTRITVIHEEDPPQFDFNLKIEDGTDETTLDWYPSTDPVSGQSWHDSHISSPQDPSLSQAPGSNAPFESTTSEILEPGDPRGVMSNHILGVPKQDRWERLMEPLGLDPYPFTDDWVSLRRWFSMPANPRVNPAGGLQQLKAWYDYWGKGYETWSHFLDRSIRGNKLTHGGEVEAQSFRDGDHGLPWNGGPAKILGNQTIATSRQNYIGYDDNTEKLIVSDYLRDVENGNVINFFNKANFIARRDDSSRTNGNDFHINTSALQMICDGYKIQERVANSKWWKDWTDATIAAKAERLKQVTHSSQQESVSEKAQFISETLQSLDSMHSCWDLELFYDEPISNHQLNFDQNFLVGALGESAFSQNQNGNSEAGFGITAVNMLYPTEDLRDNQIYHHFHNNILGEYRNEGSPLYRVFGNLNYLLPKEGFGNTYNFKGDRDQLLDNYPKIPCPPGTVTLLASNMTKNIRSGEHNIKYFESEIASPFDAGSTILKSADWDLLLPTHERPKDNFLDSDSYFEYRSDWHFLYQMSLIGDSDGSFMKRQESFLHDKDHKIKRALPNPPSPEEGWSQLKLRGNFAAGVLTWQSARFDFSDEDDVSLSPRIAPFEPLDGNEWHADWTDAEEFLWRATFEQPRIKISREDEGAFSFEEIREDELTGVIHEVITYPFKKSKSRFATILGDGAPGIEFRFECEEENYYPRTTFSANSDHALVSIRKEFGPPDNRKTHETSFVALKQYWECEKDAEGNDGKPLRQSTPNFVHNPMCKNRFRKNLRSSADPLDYIGINSMKSAPENYYLYTKIVSRACARGKDFANEKVLSEFLMSVFKERISVLESASKIWGTNIASLGGSVLSRSTEDLATPDSSIPGEDSTMQGNLSASPAVVTPGAVSKLFQLFQTEKIGESYVHIRRNAETDETVSYRDFASMMQDPLVEEKVKTKLVPLSFRPLTGKNLGTIKYVNPRPRADDEGRFRGSNSLNIPFPPNLIEFLLEAEQWYNRALSDKIMYLEIDSRNPQELSNLNTRTRLTQMARSVNLKLLLDEDEDALIEIDNLEQKFNAFDTGFASEVFHNHPSLLDLASSRIEQLTGMITDILQNQQQSGIAYTLLPVISSVYEKIKQAHPVLSDSINCSFNGINQSAGQYRDLDLGRSIGFKFATGPYTPGIQMAEYSITKGNNKDRYNVFIDSDRLLRLGPNPDLIRQKSEQNYDFFPQLLGRRTELEELPLRPQATDEFFRKVMHFCEPLSETLTDINEDPLSSENYSKAKSFGYIIKNKLKNVLYNSTARREDLQNGTTQREIFERINNLQIRDQQSVEDFLDDQVAAFSTHVYEKATEEIFLELMSSLQKSPIFEEEYADSLEDRISGRPIVTETCVGNRYSLSSASILSFDDVILGDALAEVQAEMMKPENSPFNRDFGKKEPFEIAMQTIAVKGFIRSCIIDLLLKGVTAYSVWDIEPIISTDLFKQYVRSHVLAELDRSKILSPIWPSVLKRSMGIENTHAALTKVIEEEVIKLPQFSKQLYNHKTSKEDYFNWHVYGKTIWSGPDDENKQKVIDLNNREVGAIQNGIFYRMPVPKYVGASTTLTTMNLDSHLIFGQDFEQKYNKNDSNSVYTTLSVPNVAEKSKVDKLPMSKIILEDYVRVSGLLLSYHRTEGSANLEPAPYVRQFIVDTQEMDHETTEGLVFTFEEYNNMVSRVPQPLLQSVLEGTTVKQGTRVSMMMTFDAAVFKMVAKLGTLFPTTERNSDYHSREIFILGRLYQYFNSIYRNYQSFPSAHNIDLGNFDENNANRVSEFYHQQLFVKEMLRDRFGFSRAPTESVFPDFSDDLREEEEFLNFFTLPLASSERVLSADSANCSRLLGGGFGPIPKDNSASSLRNAKLTVEGMKYCSQLLSQDQNFRDIMEQVFPVRRFMTMASIFSTSVVGGFGDQPSLMDPVKSWMAIVAAAAGSAQKNFSAVVGIGQADFQKKLAEDFPGDPDDPKCFDFPGISGEFFKAFWEELKRLMKYFPSILFRGIANQIDFAYKEMRTHYMNCDIRELSWKGIGWRSENAGLVNGLKGVTNHAQNENGKYVPIFPTSLVDFGISGYKAFFGNFRPLLKTVSKTITYAFTGMAPHFDLSGMFKIPCLDYETEWWKGAKYDFGRYGRYGHPISPFTALALSTLQLPADKKKKRNACAADEDTGELPTKDCEESQPENRPPDGPPDLPEI